ncbi:MAG: peptidylprolyl isomerase [Candidatus Methylomirabilales bacterium]
MRPRRLILGLALLVWGAAVVAGEGVLIDKVVAIVNDEVITLSQLQQEGKPLIQRMRDELRKQHRGGELQITERQILDALILRQLQLQEAAKENIVVDQDQVTAAIEQIKNQNGIRSDAEFAEALKQQNLTLEEFKTRVREQLVVDALLVRNVRTSVIVSEEEITQYYHEHADQFRQPASVRIRHILIRLPEKPSPENLTQARARAAKVLGQLKDGGDFAVIAAQYSDGAAAKDGGDLGVIRKGELHPALESVAFSLEPGSISDIVKTDAGLNIIKVEERTGGDVPSDKVRQQIHQLLFNQKLVKRMNAYFEELKKKAYIEVRLNE